MGLPEGWVTDTEPGNLTQNQQITALGNGVLPLQATSALRCLASS
jgi:DNA (cytosine-5)-methyltransferase 1